MMRILLAGGTGVLGRAVAPLLIDAGHEVAATTRRPGRAALLRTCGVVPIVADALVYRSLGDAVAATSPDVILHLLTDLRSGDSMSNAHLRRVGTANLVDAARRSGVGRMIAGSISWVYPPGPDPATEADPLDLGAPEPRRTTIAAVRALERMVGGLPGGSVLRFGQLYGPDTWYSRDGRFGDEARRGRLTATPAVVSFLHIDDAARALVSALSWPAGIWNVVDDEPAAGTEWAPCFAAAVGAPAPTSADAGDRGRPVSNAAARAAGLVLRYPSWRTGFVAR